MLSPSSLLDPVPAGTRRAFDATVAARDERLTTLTTSTRKAPR
jgi:hypothetical protein